MKRIFWVVFLALGLLPAGAQGNHNFEVEKHLDIFNALYKELDLNYVDTLSAKKNIDNAILYMLSELDPYTEYYSEENGDQLQQLSSGKYAGIGAPVLFRKAEKRCVFGSPFADNPAAKAGVRIGDVIISVDGRDFGDYTGENPAEYSEKVTEALRGEPGTTFGLVVRRPGQRRPLKFRITRENITRPAVGTTKMLDAGTGYIRLAGYTDHAARDFRLSLVSLRQQGAKRLVFDLRGNGGGLVEEAVSIVGMFVPKGRKVLHMKGKTRESNREYHTSAEPIAPDMPLVVLVDDGTASAAEITSGALQDYDRAVIVGRRTYGKGLVQQPRSLPYNTAVKMTTAKYYIPSGRCVQALDYKNRGADGQPRHLPDSLAKEFRTTAGRIVRDGGGVLPDIVVEEDSLPLIVADFAASDVLFDYRVYFRQHHDAIAPADRFALSDGDYEDFLAFVKERKYVYKRQSLQVLSRLKRILAMEGDTAQTAELVKEMEARLRTNTEEDLRYWKKDMKSLLEDYLVSDYYDSKGLYLRLLHNSKSLRAALRLLADEPRYQRILSGAPEP